jgi:RNA polymerase sigma-70 factor (ECF subfamily)
MRTMVTQTHEEFENLVERVGPAMLRYARRRSDPDTAQDVVADALMVLWRRMSDIPSDSEVAWAVGVTRRCLANAVRSAHRQRSLAVRMTALREPPGRAGVGDGDDAAIHEALAGLREGDREVLRLWAWDDLTPAEIAAVLDVRVETVSVRLHRAKKRLAAALGATDLPDAQARAARPGAGSARKGTT